MYEGLANLLELKGMGLTRDPSSNMPKAYTIKDLIPIVAEQAMPKQPIQRVAAAPMPPQMSQSVYRYEGGQMVDGGKVGGDDYVIDAYTLSALGNGSSEAGAEVLESYLPKVPNDDGSFVGRVTAPNGDGMSDNVSYEVEDGGNINEARISKDEYIIDSNQVKELGDGDVDAGTELLNKVREETRRASFGTTKQPKEISASKILSNFIRTA